MAGKRLGELDPRGLLFYDFYRYVKVQQPKYFIIENVKGLLSDNNGNTFQNWINLLGQSVNGDQFMFPHEDSLMYNLHWQVLNTKDYGIPQNRERVFLVGIRNDLPNNFVFPKPIPLKLRLKDILENEVDEKYYLSEKAIEYISKPATGGYSDRLTYLNDSEKEYAGCLTANMHKGVPYNMLKVPSATKSGYETAMEGDSINLAVPNSKTRRGRVGKQVAQTLDTSCNQGVMVVGNYHKSGHEASRIVSEEGIYPTMKENHGTTPDVMIGAFRGRNPQNPSDRTTGVPLEQRLEINDNGTSNCLTSVQKDNLIVETYNYPKVETELSGGKWDKTHEQSRRVYSVSGIAPTIHTMGGGNQEIKLVSNNYRIRKLTPKECFRLQGFPDKFHDKAVSVGVSNSQLYKQAGNSITVNVIQAILKNLLKNEI